MMKIKKLVAILAVLLAMALTVGVAASAADRISKDQAVAIALKEVNYYEGLSLTLADITRLQCDIENDDGKVYYEIAFRYGNTQYEVDVDAGTGKVLKYDTDHVFFYAFTQFWIKLWNFLFGWLK